MYFLGSCFFLLTACLTATSLGSPQRNSHQCLQSVPWSELLQELEELNKRGFSLECEEVSNEDLCFPEQMLKAVKYDNAAIVHIVHEIAEFFKRVDTPFQNKNTFLRGMYEGHAQLKTCAKPKRNISHESIVKDCFKKMDEFVTKKMLYHSRKYILQWDTGEKVSHMDLLIPWMKEVEENYTVPLVKAMGDLCQPPYNTEILQTKCCVRHLASAANGDIQRQRNTAFLEGK